MPLMWETMRNPTRNYLSFLDHDWMVSTTELLIRCAKPIFGEAEDSNLPTCYFLATSGTKSYEGEYHWATGRHLATWRWLPQNAVVNVFFFNISWGFASGYMIYQRQYVDLRWFLSMDVSKNEWTPRWWPFWSETSSSKHAKALGFRVTYLCGQTSEQTRVTQKLTWNGTVLLSSGEYLQFLNVVLQYLSCTCCNLRCSNSASWPMVAQWSLFFFPDVM